MKKKSIRNYLHATDDNMVFNLLVDGKVNPDEVYVMLYRNGVYPNLGANYQAEALFDPLYKDNDDLFCSFSQGIKRFFLKHVAMDKDMWKPTMLF